MGTVIQTENLSTEIIENQFRAPIQSEADDGSRPLTDPEAGNRDPNDDRIPPFVLPSFPDQDPLYPHVIVSEAGDEAARPDRRHDLHEHDPYVVEVKILAKSTTQLNKIKDGVVNWFEDHVETLESNGFGDAELRGGSDVPDFENDPAVNAKRLRFAGTVYTV